MGGWGVNIPVLSIEPFRSRSLRFRLIFWLLLLLVAALVVNVFSPPKFCFTPEPVCSLYRKKATTIGPLFRPLIPCGLAMLPQSFVCWEESNRLGSVFVWLWWSP